MSDRNVNIRIQDNRGLATLVGFVAVLILSRMWWTGMLTDLFALCVTPTDGLSSASYVVISFVVNLIYGVGTVLVMIWSGIWWLVDDIIQGIREWSQVQREKRGVVRQVANNATVQATKHATAEQIRPQPKPASPPSENQIVNALKALDRNIRTVSASQDEIKGGVDEMRTKFDSLDERLTVIEEAAAEPAPPKKTTRRSTSRAS